MTQSRSQLDRSLAERTAEAESVAGRAELAGWRRAGARLLPPDDAREAIQIHPTAAWLLRELLREPGWRGVGYSEFVLRAVAAARLRGGP